MTNVSLTAIDALLAVARLGSFAKASESLGLSTSATSKAIARLEDELGVKLLQRTTRSVTLTPEGERYVEGMSPLRDEMQHLTEEIRDSQSDPQGQLRISIPPVFGRRVIMPLIPGFLTRYPKVSLDIALESRAINLVKDKIDIAVRSGALPDSANLVARPIAKSGLLTCAAPAYLSKNRAPTSVDELPNHQCVRIKNAGRLNPFRFANQSLDKLSGSLVVDDIDALAQALAGGSGIGQLFEFVAAPLIAEGKLVEVLNEHRPPAMTLSALYLDRRLISPRIRAFIDYLVEHL